METTKSGKKLTVGAICMTAFMILFVLNWILVDRHEKRVEGNKQAIHDRLTSVQGVEWADVRTEVVTVTRMQDFLVARDYGRPFLCRVVELSDSRTLLQDLGQFYPLNADATLLCRIDQGAHVGDQWKYTFGKTVMSDYTIDDAEVLIDSKPLSADDR